MHASDNSVRDKWLLDLAHDLRNPLSSAIMGAQNLLRTQLTEQQQKMVELVLRSTQRALDLLESQTEGDDALRSLR